MEFAVGDLVLAFFPPLASSHVMTSWRGPFEIVEKVTPLTYRLKNVTTGEVYRELSNLNRLALYYPEYKPLLKGGEASERHEVAVGERTNPTTMEHKEEEDANNEEKDRTKNKNRKNRAGEHDSGMEIDSPEGEKRTTRQTEKTADTSRIEVEEVTGNDSDENTEESQIAPLRRGRSRLNAERQGSKEKQDQQIEEAIDKTLRSPMLAADADPAEAYAAPSRTNSATAITLQSPRRRRRLAHRER